MKKILILQSHPNKESFCSSLAKEYANGAKESQFDVDLVNLSDESFNPSLSFLDKKEESLANLQDKIKWADHLVVVYPTWWGGMPAILKGFFDRAFESGFAFAFTGKGMSWDKLLSGGTARVITTMDTPPFLYKLLYFSNGVKLLTKNILQFCGYKISGVNLIGSVRQSSEEKRNNWLKQIKELGKSGR